MVKRIRHPSAGRLDFDVEVLHDPERGHWFMLYTPRGDRTRLDSA